MTSLGQVIGLKIKQDKKSNRYDSILLWKWLIDSHLQSYPKSRDAIASKNLEKMEALGTS